MAYTFKVRQIVIAVCLCIFVSGIVAPKATEGDVVSDVGIVSNQGKYKTEYQDEYQKDLSRIRELGEANDLSNLEKFAATVVPKWKQKDEQYYFELISKLCNAFDSYDFGDKKQYNLAQKYANQALQQPEKIPLDLATRIVMCLTHNPVYLQKEDIGKEWSTQRSTNALLWLTLWRRLETGLDKTYFSKPHPIPLLNIAPPTSDAYMVTGIPPEAMADPKLKAKFEAAIKENQKKVEEYKEKVRRNTEIAEKSLRQSQLRYINLFYSPVAEKYIINIYSRPPSNLNELKKYLDTYLTDKELKVRILDAVAKNIKAAEAKAAPQAETQKPQDGTKQNKPTEIPEK